MKPLTRHRKVAPHATRIEDADPSHRMRSVIEIRRRVDHWEIPSFDGYVDTFRDRLPNEVFAARYGASDEDLNLVHQHYEGHGLTIVEKHGARRHVVIEGTIEQHNAAFGIKMAKWTKRHGDVDVDFIAPDGDVHVPDHLEDHILGVHALGNEPVKLPAVATGTGAIPTNTTHLTAAQTMLLYKTPTNLATGQGVAIAVFNGSWGAFSQTDLNATCTAAGFTAPTVGKIILDIDGDPSGNPQGELQLDVSMVALYGRGASITYFVGGNESLQLSRCAFPSPGDPVITIYSSSGTGSDGDQWSNALEDCALQGITVLQASGDTGSSPNDTNFNVIETTDSANPFFLAVGQTVIGNVSTPITSTSTFDEWMCNDLPTHNISGGGISAVWERPSYQVGLAMPTTLSTATTSYLRAGMTGRGIPDIAANGSIFSSTPYIQGGVSITTGGSSEATPKMAGILARVNAAVGRNMGFINPTLYKIGSGSSSIRDIPSNTNASNNNAIFNVGYTVTTGWDPCTGLGVINGQNLVTYLLANIQPAPLVQKYYIQVVPVNSGGNGPAAVLGPVSVAGNPLPH